MPNLNPLRYQALCGVTIFIAALCLFAPPPVFFHLIWWWGVYVMVFGGVAVLRNGWRGLLWPALVLATIGFFFRPFAVPMVVFTALICVLFFLATILARKLPTWLRTAYAHWKERRANQVETLDPVSVCVRGSAESINATEVLDRMGLLKELPE